jgi:cytochrome b561
LPLSCAPLPATFASLGKLKSPPHSPTGALHDLSLDFRKQFPITGLVPAEAFWADHDAAAHEYCLYVLLIFQPLTGLADAFFLGQPFPLFLWQVPAILPRDKWLADLLAGAHYIGAYGLLGLIALHALAALFHRFVLRDSVLQRMFPVFD